MRVVFPVCLSVHGCVGPKWRLPRWSPQSLPRPLSVSREPAAYSRWGDTKKEGLHAVWSQLWWVLVGPLYLSKILEYWIIFPPVFPPPFVNFFPTSWIPIFPHTQYSDGCKNSHYNVPPFPHQLSHYKMILLPHFSTHCRSSAECYNKI